MKLTKPQQKAVEYNKGPLLIIAGAGAGKTFVLVEKVKYLIKQRLAKPDQILALTFTDKAAREMEERVDKALPYGYFQMYISTFHAFCDQILREEAQHIGLSPAYKLQAQAESILFLKSNLFLFQLKYFRPLGNPNKFIEGLIQHCSRLRDEDVTPEQYTSWAKNKKLKLKNKKSEEDKVEVEKNLELSAAYKKFQDIKIKENVMDFADLIFYTLSLFRKRKNILEGYRKQFKYILVDEFQDTNIAQYELIKLLAPNDKNPKLTAVGDDSQSIYKFRGAAVSNILQFMDYYPKAEKMVLVDNFRSNQKILDTAYQVIKHNDPDTLEAKLDISKDLKSRTGPGDDKSINFYLADRVEEEADYVAHQIKKLKNTTSSDGKKYRWQDVAVLVRANNHADPFVRAFSRASIPYQFLGPGMLFKKAEVKELIAYLKTLYDINDSASFYRLLSIDAFDLDRRDLANLISFTRKTNLSLFETVEAYLSFFYPELSKPEYSNYKKHLFLIKKETREKLYKIYQTINRALSLLKKETAGQILYYFLEESGYLQKLINYKTEKEEQMALNISKFFDKLKTYETEHQDASVFAVVDYIEMSMELGESPIASDIDWTDVDAVNILTVHSAKGLEFPIVFLVNLTNERFPTRKRREQVPIPDELIKEVLPEGDYHILEERRLFYVGMTRAKDRVYLTSASYYGEAKRERKVSRFVVEALGKTAVLRAEDEKKMEKSQLSIFDFKTVEEMVPKRKIQLTNFSFSQIDTYKTCPLRYKYQYVLKVPTPPSAVLSFGETIHNALQEFYQLFKLGENPNFETLLQIYQRSWNPIGYSTKSYEKSMKEEGERILKDFFDKYHTKDLQIIDLEKWFKIKIEDDIFIRGKIDRVDKKNGQIEIIDYKTGKKPTDKRLKESLQLSLYALAATDPGWYNKEIDHVTLTFYFLQEGEKVSSRRKREDLAEVKKEVKQVAEKIRQGKFEPHFGFWCDFCPFKINCEAWQ